MFSNFYRLNFVAYGLLSLFLCVSCNEEKKEEKSSSERFEEISERIQKEEKQKKDYQVAKDNFLKNMSDSSVTYSNPELVETLRFIKGHYESYNDHTILYGGGTVTNRFSFKKQNPCQCLIVTNIKPDTSSKTKTSIHIVNLSEVGGVAYENEEYDPTFIIQLQAHNMNYIWDVKLMDGTIGTTNYVDLIFQKSSGLDRLYSAFNDAINMCGGKKDKY